MANRDFVCSSCGIVILEPRPLGTTPDGVFGLGVWSGSGEGLIAHVEESPAAHYALAYNDARALALSDVEAGSLRREDFARAIQENIDHRRGAVPRIDVEKIRELEDPRA